MSIISWFTKIFRHKTRLMLVVTKDRDTLQKALEETHLKPRDTIKELGRTRTGQQKFSLTLAPSSSSKYVRYSQTGRRMPQTACSHGYRDFCRTLLVIDPAAKIKSAMTQRLGMHSVNLGNFRELADDIQNVNVGSQMLPQKYSELCGCETDMPVKDYRKMLNEYSQDYKGAIRRAQGAFLRAEEAEKLR